jgi:tetratricopeptide (TPR) repeat protein
MRRAHLVGFLLLMAVPALAGAERKTVAIAPWSTASAAEYQWLGPAMASALSLRVHQQPELNGVTLRQVNAAMLQDNLKLEDLARDDAAVRLGRQLGADLILVGSYEARWPDIRLSLRTIDPQTKRVLNKTQLDGSLDDLFDIEARAARALAHDLGATKPTVAVGAFGTENLRAWMNTTLALETINWQSLSPRAADPNMPLRLPETAVQKARAQLVEATKHDPEYGEAWAALGVAQAVLGETDAAWRSFGKATALGFGHHPTAVLGAYFVRMRQGKFDAAEKILAAAIARHPGFLHARGYLGELYNHLGRRREAKATFQAYHEIAPRQPWVLIQLGYTKSRTGDSIGSIADTIAAVDMIPDSPYMLIELASRYIDAKKLAGAEDALQHAAKLFPDEGRIFVRLGYVYLQQGRDDLAIPISLKGLALANLESRRRDRGYAHLNLGRAYGRQGEIDKALDHLASAKKLGIRSFREVEKDPKLKELRADTRFADLGLY